MDYFVTTYGGNLALLIVAVGWIAKQLWPFLAEKVYANRVAAEKEEREYQRKLEEEERNDRRRERDEWVTVVGNNTQVMAQVMDVVRQLKETVTLLRYDVSHLYTVLGVKKGVYADVIREEDKEEQSGK